MPIPNHVEENIKDLIVAFSEQKIAVLEVTDTTDNTTKYAVCAVRTDDALGITDVIPLAIMIDDNPFDRYRPTAAPSVEAPPTKLILPH